MEMWIIQTGEPLHCDDDNSRPMRAMNLANFMTERGHKVVIWSSDFYHQKGKHRFNKDKTIKISDLLSIELVNSPGYKNNIGLARLYDHLVLGLRMMKRLKLKGTTPDLAFIGFPPMEVGYFASYWFRKNNINYVIDIKDPWPDHLVDAFPKRIRNFIKVLFFPYYVITKSTFYNSKSISAITEHFLDWSLKLSNRKKKENDFIFPLVSKMHQENSGREIESFKWAKKIGKRENSLNIFFVGSIGKQFNFDPILKAARYFSKKQIEINFLICGDGEHKSDIERRSSSLKNIFFTGWINRSEINVLSNICHLSIAPYINSATFKNTVSNKMIDYLSLGLPIITSIDGRGAQYLKKNNTAMIYDENDYKTLISKIERFFYDKRNVSEMRLASLNLYKNIYSYEIVYENAYKKILDLKDS